MWACRGMLLRGGNPGRYEPVGGAPGMSLELVGQFAVEAAEAAERAPEHLGPGPASH